MLMNCKKRPERTGGKEKDEYEPQEKTGEVEGTEKTSMHCKKRPKLRAKGKDENASRECLKKCIYIRCKTSHRKRTLINCEKEWREGGQTRPKREGRSANKT